MEVIDAVNLRYKLQAAIAELIEAFERTTNLWVDEIGLERPHLVGGGYEPPQVSTMIYLPRRNFKDES